MLAFKFAKKIVLKQRSISKLVMSLPNQSPFFLQNDMNTTTIHKNINICTLMQEVVTTIVKLRSFLTPQII